MSEIGDVVILDVDANELRSTFNDLESLPSDLVSIWNMFYHIIRNFNAVQRCCLKR